MILKIKNKYDSLKGTFVLGDIQAQQSSNWLICLIYLVYSR